MFRRVWSRARDFHCLQHRPGTPQKFSRYSSTATELGSLSPALLALARSASQEHKELSNRIAASFDTSIAKRLGELTPVVDAFSQWQKATDSLHELRTLVQDSGTDPELRDLAKEDIEPAEKEIKRVSQTLTTALVPRHPFEHLPCLLEIQPGVGGTEAALFAADLLRMYESFCSKQKLKAKLLKYEDAEGVSDPNGSDAPLKEAILEIEGEGAYGLLRTEAGVHRVQRVPATESKGRVHTSVAAVVVLPSFPENPNDADGAELDFLNPESDYYVNPSDVRTEVMRASGAGGQHVNKTDSKVRLTHLPTGLVVSMEDSRSQHRNRADAWQVLRSRLAQAKRDAREDERAQLRKSVPGVGKMGRSDKIRTYNYSQQRVTDHRSGISVHQLDDVIEGGQSLAAIIDSVKEWLDERELEAFLAEQELKSAAAK